MFIIVVDRRPHRSDGCRDLSMPWPVLMELFVVTSNWTGMGGTSLLCLPHMGWNGLRNRNKNLGLKFISIDVLLGMYSLIWTICCKLMWFYWSIILLHIIFLAKPSNGRISVPDVPVMSDIFRLLVLSWQQCSWLSWKSCRSWSEFWEI